MDTNGLIRLSVMVCALNVSGVIKRCHLSTTADHRLETLPQCPWTKPVFICHDVDEALDRGFHIRSNI
jgi:hypothetical protein